MSQDSPAPVSWGTRLTWASLGAVVGAAVMWMVQSGEGTPEPAATGPSTAAESRPPAEAKSPVEPTAPAPDGGSTSTSSRGSTGDGSSTGDLVSTSTTGDDLSTDTDEFGTGDDAMPEIPLPRMPGTRFMRRFRRPSEEGDGWTINLALSVPASGYQVESFYRSAMKDAGLKVLGRGPGPGAISEGYRAVLKGKSRDAIVDVTIRQRPDKLRTVVRLTWRTQP